MENDNDSSEEDHEAWVNEDRERRADLVELCRTAYCSLAALVLWEHLGRKAELWGLKGVGPYAHFFLMNDGRALDIAGYCSLEEMKRIYPDQIHEAERVSYRQVKRMCDDAANPRELSIVEDRILDHLKAHPEIFGAEV